MSKIETPTVIPTPGQDGTILATAIAVAASVKKSVLEKETSARSVYVPRWLMRDLLAAVEEGRPAHLDALRDAFRTSEDDPAPVTPTSTQPVADEEA